MRKIKLQVDELSVDTFETLKERGGQRGTVYGRFTETCPSNHYCTNVGSPTCTPELCQGEETASPRERRCVTPYVECATDGWTCDYC